MNRTCSFLLLLLTLLLTSAQMALAAAVSINASGNGVFVIEGSGMAAVAGVDLTVSYDATQLASPAVTQGSLISGALMAANTSKPGSIKIAAVSTRPFPASGQIVTITFATHTGTGRISVTGSMIDSKGSPVSGGGVAVAADSQTTTPSTSPGFTTTAGIPFSQPAINTNSSTTAITGAIPATAVQTSLGGAAVSGTVSMPEDVQPKNDPEPTEPAAESPPAEYRAEVQTSEPVSEQVPVPAAPKTEPVTLTYIKGALENFSTYKGEKTPANYIALLSKQDSATIRQEPAFVLSDGSTALKIVTELKNAGDKSPNFALQGAKLISLTADNASSTWIITALPQTGVDQAILTILTDREIIEFPLTIAPPVKTVTSAEADFSAFLKDSGAAPPKHDLNNDGRHDYLDDFIYTINYLSKKGAPVKPAT